MIESMNWMQGFYFFLVLFFAIYGAATCMHRFYHFLIQRFSRYHEKKEQMKKAGELE